MNPIVLENERVRLHIRPDLGGGISELSVRGSKGLWNPVLRRAPGDTRDAEELACFLMAPWCNRIAGGRFRFGGREHVIRSGSPDGHAIHGDVRWRAWTVLDRSPVSARLEWVASEAADRNWPWAYRAVVRYELDGGMMTCRLGVGNLDRTAMPVGLGFHPYWMRRVWDERDEVRLRANFSGRYPMAGAIPTGAAHTDAVSEGFGHGRAMGVDAMDDVFAGSLDESVIEWPRSGVRACMSCSAELAHAVVYVPTSERGGALGWFCVEPSSMVNDGFNMMERGGSNTGARVLEPGKEMWVEWRVRFEVESVPGASGATLGA